MSKSLEEIAKNLESVKGGDKQTPLLVTPENQKIIKVKKDGTPDKRQANGGKGKVGRKPLPLDEKRRTLKKSWENFAMGEVEIRRVDKGTHEERKFKMQRVEVAQEMLFEKVKEKDVSAIKEFNDRVLGKSKQPITGGDEDDTPLRLDVDITRIGTKIYGLEDTD